MQANLQNMKNQWEDLKTTNNVIPCHKDGTPFTRLDQFEHDDIVYLDKIEDVNELNELNQRMHSIHTDPKQKKTVDESENEYLIFKLNEKEEEEFVTKSSTLQEVIEYMKNHPTDKDHPYTYKSPKGAFKEGYIYKSGLFVAQTAELPKRPFISATFSATNAAFVNRLCLIDTGATNTVISEEFQLTIGAPGGEPVSLDAVGGTRVEGRKCAMTVIVTQRGNNNNNIEKTVEGIVMGTNEYNLLGMDFLQHCKLEMNGTKTVSLVPKQI